MKKILILLFFCVFSGLLYSAPYNKFTYSTVTARSLWKYSGDWWVYNSTRTDTTNFEMKGGTITKSGGINIINGNLNVGASTDSYSVQISTYQVNLATVAISGTATLSGTVNMTKYPVIPSYSTNSVVGLSAPQGTICLSTDTYVIMIQTSSTVGSGWK